LSLRCALLRPRDGLPDGRSLWLQPITSVPARRLRAQDTRVTCAREHVLGIELVAQREDLATAPRRCARSETTRP
jgi:hypothetical protein